MLRCLEGAGYLAGSGDALRSLVRFSTLGEQLFVHSAFPTEDASAVFFGPDTYRFARAIDPVVASLPRASGLRILDVGAGSGAGGLHAAHQLRGLEPHVTLSDINAEALHFCAVNTALNDVSQVRTIESDLYKELPESFDLIVSNPPYLVDSLARSYRHGGGAFGSALSLRIVEEGLPRLALGGRLLLYTASAIVHGVDLFECDLRRVVADQKFEVAYCEVDPDVFGEELDATPYDQADRIAVVTANILRN